MVARRLGVVGRESSAEYYYYVSAASYLLPLVQVRCGVSCGAYVACADPIGSGRCSLQDSDSARSVTVYRPRCPGSTGSRCRGPSRRAADSPDDTRALSCASKKSREYYIKKRVCPRYGITHKPSIRERTNPELRVATPAPHGTAPLRSQNGIVAWGHDRPFRLAAALGGTRPR